MNIYVDERVASGSMRGSTVVSARQVLRVMAEHLGDIPVETCTSADLTDWLGSMGHLSAGTRASRLSIVRQFFGWLQRRGHRPDNPALNVERPRIRRTVPRALPPDAITKVFAICADRRTELIVSLMVMEGLRAAEVATLDVAGINFDTGTMCVTGKGEHERMLPISVDTMRALKAYLAELPTVSWGPVVRSHRDLSTPLTPGYVSRLMTALLFAAGLKRLPRDGVSGHAFRHTAASDTYDRCHDLRLVQEMLGHTSITTTQIYLRRASPEQLRDVMGGRSYR